MKKVINNNDVLELEPKERVKISFSNGFNQIPIGKTKEVKKRIMSVLSITDRGSFDLRMKGKVSYNKAEISAVESIFNEYDVTENIWCDAK